MASPGGASLQRIRSLPQFFFFLFKKQQQQFVRAICCHDKQSLPRSTEAGNSGDGHLVVPVTAEHFRMVDLSHMGCLAAAFSSCIISSYIFNAE